MKEARSVEHLCTHIPKNPFCPACQQAKAQRRPARDNKKIVQLGPPPSGNGDQITCDHLTTLAEEDMGIDKSRVGLVCKDRGSTYKDVYPTGGKSADETRRSLEQFIGRKKCKQLHTDAAPEFVAAAEALNIQNHTVATPGRKEGNAVAERCVRSVLEGTRTNLLLCAMAIVWWPWAARHWCFCDNVSTRNGKSAYEKWFGHAFAGLLIPFGALVSFMPHPDGIKNKLKFEPRTNQGVFLGYTITQNGWKK
jgi:hypothetical protein